MAERTRDQMEAIIAKHGGSVMLGNGKIVSRIQDLPTAAQLAKKTGDPAEMKAAKDALLARQAALQLEIDALDKPADPAPKAASAPAAPPKAPPTPVK